MKSSLEDLENDKKGFVNLKVNKKFIKPINLLDWKVKDDYLEAYFDQVSLYGYLKPYSLKEVAPGKLQLTNPLTNILNLCLRIV